MLGSASEKKSEKTLSEYQRLAILLDFNQCISHKSTTEEAFILENRPLLNAIEKATSGIKECVLFLFTKQSFMEIDLSMVLKGSNGSCLPFYQFIQKYFTDKGIPLKLDMTMLQDRLYFEKEGTTAQKILQMVTADSKASVTYPPRYYPMENQLFFLAINTSAAKTKRAHFYHYIHKAMEGLPAGAKVLCHIYDNDKMKLRDWEKWIIQENAVPPPNLDIVFNLNVAGSSKGPQLLGRILTKSTNQIDINYLYHTVTFFLDRSIDLTKGREKPLSDEEISQCKKQVIDVLIGIITKYYGQSNSAIEHLAEMLNAKNKAAHSLQEVTFLLELIKQFIDSMQFYYVSGKAKPLNPSLEKLCGKELWSVIIKVQTMVCNPSILETVELLVNKMSELNEKKSSLKEGSDLQQRVDAQWSQALLALKMYQYGEALFNKPLIKLNAILAEIEAAKTSSTINILSKIPPLNRKVVTEKKELSSHALMIEKNDHASLTDSEKPQEEPVKEVTAAPSRFAAGGYRAS